MAKKETDAISLSRLKEDLRIKQPGRLYVFWGEEAYLREYYIKELRSCIEEEGGGNVEVFDKHNFSADGFSDAVLSYPMLTPRRFILVRDIDPYAPEARYKSLFEELLCDIPDFDCIVFDLGTAAPSGKKNKKIEEAVKDVGIALEFLRPSESELTRWIIRRFAALEKNCQPAEAALLARLCGGMMFSAIPEIEKVAAAAKTDRITSDDINAMVTPVIDVVIYRITDAVTSRNRQSAISLLSSLIAQGTSCITLASAIGRAMRQLYSARLFRDKGCPVSDFMEAWHLKSRYVADMIVSQAQRFRPGALRKGVWACFETEMRLLNSEPDPRTELEMLITELCK
ncbi:MAG: DNA polymerase III subunit delta [Clostridia bacterium]|nr:DNA polymerase III subunit delta [Clostridia bacterium]